jgi:hypothetical protein
MYCLNIENFPSQYGDLAYFLFKNPLYSWNKIFFFCLRGSKFRNQRRQYSDQSKHPLWPLVHALFSLSQKVFSSISAVLTTYADRSRGFCSHEIDYNSSSFNVPMLQFSCIVKVARVWIIGIWEFGGTKSQIHSFLPHKYGYSVL